MPASRIQSNGADGLPDAGRVIHMRALSASPVSARPGDRQGRLASDRAMAIRNSPAAFSSARNIVDQEISFSQATDGVGRTEILATATAMRRIMQFGMNGLWTQDEFSLDGDIPR
jgi:hypothetical protein